MAIEIQEDLVSSKHAADAPKPSPFKLSFSAKEKVTNADRILFTERLALQLSTGVPLYTALQSIQLQMEKPAMRLLVQDLADTIVGGSRFSEALAKHPAVFSKTYVNLVAVSETAGFLPQVLDQLVDMDEKAQRLQSAMLSALTYPAFLLFFSFAVTVFVLVAVFPKFGDMFASIYDSLPASTKILMAISDLFIHFPLHILVATATILVTGVAIARRPAAKRWIDRKKMQIPVIGSIFVKLYLVRIMRTMGISLDRGVTVLAALAASREVVQNGTFQDFMKKLESDVQEGKGIAAGFKEAPFIPSNVIQMIVTGEESGKLGQVMSRIADFYDREITRQLTQLTKLAEPVMLLFMGGVVGIIVSSLILPVFKMSRVAG